MYDSKFAQAQRAYDNLSPEENDGRDDYVSGQVDLLLNADDADMVEFNEFADDAEEAIADADDEHAVFQLILAVRRGEFELAEKLALLFEDAIVEMATKLVEKEIEE